MDALIVDDSRVMRKLLGSLLTQCGFTITEAGNGLEGLERLKAGSLPQLALVDWNMPEMTGLEMIRVVRTHREWDALRILMVTSETSPDQMDEALAAGADEYLMKPFTSDSLRSKLELMGITQN